jgi:pimeloyl-ACP methyl ester carboxylesterase
MGFGVVHLLDAVFRRMFRSAGLRPGSATVNAEDDTVIHYWAHPSLLRPPPSDSDSEQRQPVVVLIHGFGPDPTWQWAAQAGPLSRHFRLVVPTLLFFGASGTRAPARSDASQAAALAALLAGPGQQHLPGLGAGRTVHVVGTSYGGLVAYHLARELQRQGGGGGGVRVGKVVLCDSDACKGAEDDRALAARSGVAEVAELLAPADTRALRRLMAVCAHRPVKYVPECLLRDMLRVCAHSPRDMLRPASIVFKPCAFMHMYAEILRGQEGGEDGAHQRDRHRRRLRACSAASGTYSPLNTTRACTPIRSLRLRKYGMYYEHEHIDELTAGGAHHLGRVRPDLPGGQSAQGERVSCPFCSELSVSSLTHSVTFGFPIQRKSTDIMECICVRRKLGEKATVKVIPNAGHLPQQEDSKLFNRVLLDFLLRPSSTAA